MNTRELEQALGPDLCLRIGELHCHESIGSTNTEALRLEKERGRGNRLVIAQSQTAGRGRRGRSWLSPSGSGVFMSLARESREKVNTFQSLSLVTALSVRAALEDLGVDDLRLKWPNDILHGNRKLAGILLESVSGAESTYVVFGIGINIAVPGPVRELIGRPVTDLKSILGDSPVPALIVKQVCENLLSRLTEFSEQGFSPFADAWNALDRYRGKDVVIASGERKMIGRSHGVDKEGALILETAAGKQAIMGGEIFPSLAAIDGKD